MFKIGDFSRLSQVTIKTLRYYDELGLLKPAQVDRFTGYRYYTAEQMARLNRILVLKDLGLSLEQIGRLLNDELPLAEMRGMLKIKQAEALQTLQAEQERLNRIEIRLGQMEKEATMPEYEVVLKKIEPLRVAAVRQTIPVYSQIGSLFDELTVYGQKHNVRFKGGLAIWYDPEYRESDIDGEAACITDDPLPADERIKEKTLAGIETAACVVHQGSFQTMNGAYTALLGWLDAHGYVVNGPNRELYLNAGNAQDDPSFVTEIQFPVVKAGN